MTTVVDMAELEATIAESDLSEDEQSALRERLMDGEPLPDAVSSVLAAREQPEPEPQPQPQPEPEPGEPTDKQLKQLDSEQRRHEARVREVMGPFVAGFEACEECGGVGLLPPGPKPQEHEHFRACETCAGFGVVKTGSLRPGNEVRDCPGCMGRGYLEALDEQGAPLAGAGTVAPGAAPTQTAPPALELAPAPAGGAPEPRFGVPAWMGDPNLNRQAVAADVLARVETVRPGDRIYTPTGDPAGYSVVVVNHYDDGAYVVVYSTGRPSRFRFGEELLTTAQVLASLAPMRAGERLRCRRSAAARPAGPPRSSA